MEFTLIIVRLLENQDHRAWVDWDEKNAQWLGGWLSFIEGWIDPRPASSLPKPSLEVEEEETRIAPILQSHPEIPASFRRRASIRAPPREEHPPMDPTPVASRDPRARPRSRAYAPSFSARPMKLSTLTSNLPSAGFSDPAPGPYSSGRRTYAVRSPRPAAASRSHG